MSDKDMKGVVSASDSRLPTMRRQCPDGRLVSDDSEPNCAPSGTSAGSRKLLLKRIPFRHTGSFLWLRQLLQRMNHNEP
jgi:hypothetical protein